MESIQKKPLSREVLGSLRRYIISRKLQPGDRLPTERELAADLGVSRTTVREALNTLETLGALNRHPGRGAVLQPIDFGLLAEVSQFLMVRSAADIDDLFVARRVLELSLLPLVAANATEEHFHRMEMANQLMEAEIEADGIAVDGDIAFHRSLLAAANNKFLAQFGDLIQEFFRDRRTRMLVDADVARHAVAEHREIVTLLRAKDVAAAEAVMTAHIDRYKERGVVHRPAPPSEATEIVHPHRIEPAKSGSTANDRPRSRPRRSAPTHER
ncbi:MAG: FadR/GntR family transcriptional regulator [Armatimonadota bacterium]